MKYLWTILKTNYHGHFYNVSSHSNSATIHVPSEGLIETRPELKGYRVGLLAIYITDRVVVALSTLFINLLTVLLFQHLFQIQYLELYSTYQSALSL